MKAKQHIALLQEALGIPLELRFPQIGPITREAFAQLAKADPEAEWIFKPIPKSVDTPLVQSSGPDDAGELERQINDMGLRLVKHFEGCYLKAYRCPAGVWTIGYGHTGLRHQDGTVHAGRVITQAEAEALLRHDMRTFERDVQRLVRVPISDDAFSALVSFHFNTGALGKSSLLRRLNSGENQRVLSSEFLKWDKANGRQLAGLTRRRNAEMCLFNSRIDDMLRFLRG